MKKNETKKSHATIPLSNALHKAWTQISHTPIHEHQQTEFLKPGHQWDGLTYVTWYTLLEATHAAPPPPPAPLIVNPSTA
jgi:hypothetical protein